MHVDRLTRMAKLLRADATNPTGVQFDLDTWGSYGDMGVDEWRQLAEGNQVPMSCGTQACAFGLAAISGEFDAEGLTYRASINNHNIIPTLTTEYGAVFTQFAAARVLFDITRDDANYFFDPECYEETPREAEGEIFVAERIEAFIKGVVDEEFHPKYNRDSED